MVQLIRDEISPLVVLSIGSFLGVASLLLYLALLNGVTGVKVYSVFNGMVIAGLQNNQGSCNELMSQKDGETT